MSRSNPPLSLHSVADGIVEVCGLPPGVAEDDPVPLPWPREALYRADDDLDLRNNK